MKIKILVVLQAISIFVIVLLGIYTVKVQPECERIHLDDIERDEDIAYLDKEMARMLADIVMGAEDNLTDEANTRYDVEIEFDGQHYEWVISYEPNGLQPDNEANQGKVVRIRKDNGVITVSENNF
ncbi:hypothetical protein AALA79_02220 [Lachnospiraceae bacterium 64-25]|nr:hypothetical protein IMSAGC005_02436 [Lachnospiraceae bacterium]